MSHETSYEPGLLKRVRKHLVLRTRDVHHRRPGRIPKDPDVVIHVLAVAELHHLTNPREQQVAFPATTARPDEVVVASRGCGPAVGSLVREQPSAATAVRPAAHIHILNALVPGRVSIRFITSYRTLADSRGRVY